MRDAPLEVPPHLPADSLWAGQHPQQQLTHLGSRVRRLVWAFGTPKVLGSSWLLFTSNQRINKKKCFLEFLPKELNITQCSF